MHIASKRNGNVLTNFCLTALEGDGSATCDMLRLNCDLLFQAAVLEMEKRKKIEDAQIEEEQEQVKNKKKDFKKNVQVCDLALSSCLIQVFLVVCS